MAQEVITRLVDDVDGSEATGTIQFALGRTSYEIDLHDDHIAEFEQDMAKWIKYARRVKQSSRKARQPRKQSSRNGHASHAPVVAPEHKPTPEQFSMEGYDPKAAQQATVSPPEADDDTRALYGSMRTDIRDWGRAHGYKVGKQGRLPGQLVLDWCAELQIDPAQIFTDWRTRREQSA